MTRCGLIAMLLVTTLMADELDKSAWKAAREALESAVRTSDGPGVMAGIEAVGADNSDRAVETILEVLPACLAFDVYEGTVDVLAGMDDPKAQKAIDKAVKKSRTPYPVRFLLVEVLTAREDPERFAALLEDDDLRIALRAVELLAARRLAWAVSPAIERYAELERRDPDGRLAGALVNALTQVLGESAETAEDWRKLWEILEPDFGAAGREPTGGSESTVVDRMRNRRPDDFTAIEGLEPADIVVVKGIYDEVEQVLEALDLPYTLVERAEFNDFDLDPRAVLIFNCDSGETPINGELVKAFVAAGGYLFTSDWELQNVITPAFGSTLTMAGATDEHEFPIVPGEHTHHHPLLTDVFPTNPFDLKNFTWHIDGASYTLRLSKSCETLVWSDDLATTYGGFGSVAVYFPFPARATGRRGAVLHVLSHFQKQTDPDGDGFALQQLLLNFIVAKQKSRRSR